MGDMSVGQAGIQQAEDGKGGGPANGQDDEAERGWEADRGADGEDLLDHFLGFAAVAQDANRDGKNQSRIALKQEAQTERVILHQAGYEFRIVRQGDLAAGAADIAGPRPDFGKVQPRQDRRRLTLNRAISVQRIENQPFTFPPGLTRTPGICQDIKIFSAAEFPGPRKSVIAKAG